MRLPSLLLLLAFLTLGWGCHSAPERTDSVRELGLDGTRGTTPARLPSAQRPPTGLGTDDWLSQIAACHLLRVGQNMDVAVTDMAVIAAAEKYGYRVEDIIERSNQLVQEHAMHGEALVVFATESCRRVSEATETPSSLVRFEPDGTPRTVWLRIDGADIADGFADETIAELRRRRAVGLVINSPGGSVFEARKLGRFLRAMGYRTAVDQACTSACIDILAGGVERYVTPSAKLGIHQSRVPARFSSHEGGQRYVADSFLYLREMGVDPDVAIAAAAIPNNKILIISLTDALKTGLVTDVIERLQ
ncbi:hypothetical protein [Thiocapsa imhoffii]|uniref:COG3904 family protein n=1 Tax=Thiocapsa imhoffii TaxID=382777 RepID=UPI001907A917|nr:hypothetical protein [Thiocapsa imhoffii]